MRSSTVYLSMAKKFEWMEKMITLPTITLAAEEADNFIQYVWDESVMKGHARMVRMAGETKNIRGLGMGSARVLYPSATFSSSDYITTFAHNKIELDTEELRGAVLILDSDLEDINVGSAAAFKTHIMQMVAKTISNELDEIFWIADKESLSGFANTDARSVLNGWRYQFDNSQEDEDYENDVTGSTVLMDASNTVTDRATDYTITTGKYIVEQNASAPYNQEIKLDEMIKQLPAKYKRGGLANLRFFMNDNLVHDYIASLAARATPLGDAVIQGKIGPSYSMVPLVACPLMPNTMEINSSDAQKENFDEDNGTLSDILLTTKDNLIIGIQKQIQMEAERSAADRGYYYFWTIRADCKVVNVAAAVLGKRFVVI